MLVFLVRMYTGMHVYVSVRLDCVRRISDLLHDDSSLPAAVALLRAAREVWPDNGEFGAPDISPEQEFMVRRRM